MGISSHENVIAWIPGFGKAKFTSLKPISMVCKGLAKTTGPLSWKTVSFPSSSLTHLSVPWYAPCPLVNATNATQFIGAVGKCAAFILLKHPIRLFLLVMASVIIWSQIINAIPIGLALFIRCRHFYSSFAADSKVFLIHSAKPPTLMTQSVMKLIFFRLTMTRECALQICQRQSTFSV